MQIKAAGDKQPDLDALAALLERPDLDAATRRRIEQEIRQIRAGAAGERDAAWQIEFHYGASRNYVTIHDLRLEVGDRVAQIDHLVLTRLLDVWVLESKHFADGVAVNEHGEWSALYGRSERGMPSPVEQNRRHVMVLDDLFSKGVVHLPKRLGLVTIRPRIRSLILVSDNARIVRPRPSITADQQPRRRQISNGGRGDRTRRSVVRREPGAAVSPRGRSGCRGRTTCGPRPS